MDSKSNGIVEMESICEIDEEAHQKRREQREKWKNEAWANRMRLERAKEIQFKLILDTSHSEKDKLVLYDMIYDWFYQYKGFISPFDSQTHLESRFGKDPIDEIVEDVLHGLVYRQMRASMGFK